MIDNGTLARFAMSLHRKLTKLAKGSLALLDPVIKKYRKYITFIKMGCLRDICPLSRGMGAAHHYHSIGDTAL